MIFYETGGTIFPAIRRGAGNRHIGLIQFGIPEQRKYGASQDQSFAEQLPAVERDLVDRRFEPGMGILDIPGAYLRACGEAWGLAEAPPPGYS